MHRPQRLSRLVAWPQLPRVGWRRVKSRTAGHRESTINHYSLDIKPATFRATEHAFRGKEDLPRCLLPRPTKRVPNRRQALIATALAAAALCATGVWGIAASTPSGHMANADTPVDSWADKSDLSTCVTCNASACSLDFRGLQRANCLHGLQLAYAARDETRDSSSSAQRPFTSGDAFEACRGPPWSGTC